MLDFVTMSKKSKKDGVIVFPEFNVTDTKDLMIRGRDFYAVWDENKGFWSKNESDVRKMVDTDLLAFSKTFEVIGHKEVQLLKNFSSNQWVNWQRYCKTLPDNYHELDDHITFSNSNPKKEDYVTRTLPYPLEEAPITCYEKLMSTLYSPEDREKLEWAIGSIITGDSKTLQKFIVLYGGPGTGKSTVLNIIQLLFPGYYSIFDSRALTSSNNSFALEPFRDNPLIAIQHDGDLSRIEDNTKLNSIVSHEEMTINEKFKSTYTSKFHSFLFMGTNKPVRITDSKSGILRRLIDVSPTGNKIPGKEFKQLMSQIKFELSGIAYHCLEVYKTLGYRYYDDYIPVSMIGETNDIYNFIEDSYDFFCDDEGGIALKTAWLRYKDYCDDARVAYPLSMRQFRTELKSYFSEFRERDGNRYSVYIGFLRNKFQQTELEKEPEEQNLNGWLHLRDDVPSEFDDIFKDCPAQYAKPDGTPLIAWNKVRSQLKDLDTRELHYVKVPKNLIVIDFDLKNEKGEKDEKINLKEANQWPPTYAELSKSGSGIHLHYYYEGDVDKLSRIYGKDVEIKVFKGNSSLRRMLTKCNDYPIATIRSGLPMKGETKMFDANVLTNEKALRTIIIKNLRKEYHPATKPSIDFIYKVLDDAYNQGIKYDVTDLRQDVQTFALRSSHQADYCVRLVSKMKFKSEEQADGRNGSKEDGPILFFDVEVFPNLFVVVWKKQGAGNQFVKLINPKPQDIEELTHHRLVGFNNRRYDNHILYARMMGYNEEQLYQLSQQIINSKERDVLFGAAYNLSYTDIYDFLSATNKMSLKKWEIKLGIHHQELGLPWDQPVPEELWGKVADYCTNDVFATEAVWDANQADWNAREILADWAGMTVNDTTNTLTTKLIIGDDKDPWSKYVYTDLSTIYPGYEYNPYGIEPSRYNPSAKIVKGKAIYKGEDPGDGGRVYANPGIYTKVALLDIASMHPHSLIRLNLFGDEYTLRFKNIVDARIMIKHQDYDGARQILPPHVHKYLDDPEKAKALADALKTAINSVYGLTSASFKHKLRDPRNVDNIVAKYGALFMIDLVEEVEKRGYTVVHVKTDSIKIADATPEIIQFCMDFAQKYGFTFEHEDTYEKICLVNDAVYIAQYQKPHIDKKTGREIWWTATGTQFQVPYVFKKLFSHEPIEFNDICETKSVDKGAIYLDFNEGFPDVLLEEKELGKLESKYKKGEVSDVIFEEESKKLTDIIEKGHDYRFVGKVGGFCPIKEGFGGGYLVRESNGKHYAVTGTKKKDGSGAYRWMESEMARNLNNPDAFDLSYYDNLVDEAVDEISKYDDFEWFCSIDREFPMNKPEVAA